MRGEGYQALTESKMTRALVNIIHVTWPVAAIIGMVCRYGFGV